MWSKHQTQRTKSSTRERIFITPLDLLPDRTDDRRELAECSGERPNTIERSSVCVCVCLCACVSA